MGIIKKLFFSLRYRGLLDWMPDSMYLKILFRLRTGYCLNLESPQTFNEKIQWLKLYDRRTYYTELVDKMKVRDYVSQVIGEEYLIPLIGGWHSFNEIDFNDFPDEFVLKTNHDSGSVIIVKNKNEMDIEETREKITLALEKNYYKVGREWPYKDVKPCILAEKLMIDQENEDLKDYKFMCFNGKVRCSFVCTERRSSDGLKVTFFDREWNRMPFCRHYPQSTAEILPPKNLQKMYELAEKLSEGIPFVRVDFYEVNGRIYFGEMTFYPGSGLEEFSPTEYDYILGEWITLPTKE